jgi:hypothetical protein
MNINLTITPNYNLDAQLKVFKSVAKYLGLMDNNLPDQEIHHDVDNVFFYNQDKINFNTFEDFCNILHDLDIKFTLKKSQTNE